MRFRAIRESGTAKYERVGTNGRSSLRVRQQARHLPRTPIDSAARRPNPGWFHNLRANPDTTVQIGPTVMQVRARVADGDERDRLWARFVAMYPGSEAYQRNAGERLIPIVVLTPH
jgi:deazaflavin-dependent oxidoreductase (nitroreductase family)